MTRTQYNQRLWQIRRELDVRGIFKPINIMVKSGYLEANKNNHNYISGRIRDDDFLELLERFNDAN